MSMSVDRSLRIDSGGYLGRAVRPGRRRQRDSLNRQGELALREDEDQLEPAISASGEWEFDADRGTGEGVALKRIEDELESPASAAGKLKSSSLMR